MVPPDLTARRILDWAGLLNARDVGGLPTMHGGRIRPGALVRSDVLTRLTDEGRAALVEHGVRTIVDVRSAGELAEDDVYPFAADDEVVKYLNVPFSLGRDADAWAEIKARYERAETREELNRIDLDGHRAGLVAIARAVADAPPGGVLVHCHAGKDRTGLVIGLLLSLVGVADDQIADDYALTSLNFEPLIVEWLDRMTDDPRERQRLRGLAEPRREVILDTLGYLRGRYGSALEYLMAGGLEQPYLDRLEARLVERP